MNNFYIISYSTDNFQKLTDIFLNSCYKIGIPQNNICIKYEPVSFDNEQSSFRGDKWYECLLNKMKHVIDSLIKLSTNKECEYVIVSDCDVWFIDSNKYAWKELESFLKSSLSDIFFMPEFVGHDMANGGFYIIKNNSNIYKTIFFFENIYTIMKNTNNSEMAYGDQSLINEHKKSINYTYIPKQYLIWGPLIGDISKCLIHHAVCAANLEQKLLLIDNIKQKYNLS